MIELTGQVFGRAITITVQDEPRELFLPLYPVYENGVLLAAFLHLDHAESFAHSRIGMYR